MASTTKKTSKPIFKTGRPYTEPRWPQLTPVQRDNIVDLLCNLIQPLGDHRKTHIQPSKGKKRKRESKKNAQKDTALKDGHSQDTTTTDVPPPPPEIGNHILIGLNSVTRHLEALAAQTAPPTAPAHPSLASKDEPQNEDPTEKDPTEEAPEKKPDSNSSQELRPLSLVLITHNHPPASLPHAHIPTLIHLSTLGSPTSVATRLIAVPPGCEPPIASALHIPHVGALGVLEGAPGADSLVAYVREHTGVTECAWIDEAMRAEWKGVKFDIQKG